MKRLVLLIILIFVLGLLLPTFSFAQGMMGTNAINSDGHTDREEAEGKAVWEKLQTKELACKDLSDDNFGTLGEYFMGQMVGGSHEAMNNMMIQMMGEQGEEQMHVVMGKRLSGCDTSAAFPSQGIGFMPMIQMIMGGGMMGNGGNSMIGNFAANWITIILTWAVLILAIIALIKRLTKK